MSSIDLSRARISVLVDKAFVQSLKAGAAPLSLRLGLGWVFLVFGAEKIVDWRGWAVILPPSLADLVARTSGLDLGQFLRALGYVELVLGVHLVLGFFTRATAAACAALLVIAVMLMGTTGIGVRDCGLLAAAVALALSGGGPWSLDNRRSRS